MPVEVILDASVAAKAFITETGSDAARAFLASGMRLVAPDLILIELANVAVKRHRNGDIPRSQAEAMVAAAPSLIHEIVPLEGLLDRAFALAVDHGVSTYDAVYVALAEARGCDLVTADTRLIAKLAQAGVSVTARTV
jgi:predicted nucleic acid-binding protein